MMCLREVKDIKLVQIDDLLDLKDEERFQSGPRGYMGEGLQTNYLD